MYAYVYIHNDIHTPIKLPYIINSDSYRNILH